MKMNRMVGWAVAAVCLLTAGAGAGAAESEDGFKPLFNGKTLEGWDGDPKFWSVVDGNVVGKTTAENPTKGNTFLIWRAGTVDDFVLRFSYKIVNGNSGVQYRSKDMGNWVVGGYQGDFEAGKTYSGILYEERGPRGIMAQRGEKVVVGEDGKKTVVEKFGDSAKLQAGIKHEDWNEYEITARGNHFTHMINGNKTVEVTDNDGKNFMASGVLALQLHAGPPMTVEFKDVRLKRLPLEQKKK